MSDVRLPRTSLRVMEAPTSDLRELCQRELAQGGAAPTASVQRVVVEVQIHGRTELVTLQAEGTRLIGSATDGHGGRVLDSPATRAALAWLGGAAAPAMPSSSSSGALPSPNEPIVRLDERLTELSVAIVRSGIDDEAPLPVRDALARLAAELPVPLPLPASRWLARLTLALAEADARQVARLLSGTDALRNALGDAGARPVSDTRYVEIGREPADAWDGVPIERRVLVELESGTLVTETRLATNVLGASIGPCPRVLDVGLGQLRGGAPPELVAQQYTVSSDVTTDAWDRIEGYAVPVQHAARAALALLADAPALAEPVSLVLGPTVEDHHVVDAEGARIPLSREDVAAVETLIDVARAEPLRWLLVRWTTRDAGVSAVPIACAHRVGASWRHVRLR